MITLSENQILEMHAALIERYGGTYGIRDKHLLESALNVPFQTFDGADLYPTVIEKTVRLTFGLVMNHPFVDGNKRIGALALTTTLSLNQIAFTTSKSDLIKCILDVASGRLDERDLLAWVLERIGNSDEKKA